MSETVKQTEKEWLDEAISKEHIRYYNYEHFNKIKTVGSGAFNDVYRAKWKRTEKVFALKSFKNKDHKSIALKEFIHEVINFLSNIFYSSEFVRSKNFFFCLRE
jgi:serine/threonine protein kinase